MKGKSTSKFKNMTLSIIIPVFNEENTIKEIIKRVWAVSLPVKKEIIVVNDGSFDKTSEILKKLKKEFNFILKEHQENQGKGAAIRTALSQATGDFILIQDADLELNPQEYPILLKPLLEKKAEVVYGSRFLGKKEMDGNKKKRNWPFYLGGRFLTFLANLLYGLNITDEPIGYKVFKSEILKNMDLECKGFEFCPEVTAKIAKQGIKIYEVPVSCDSRSRKEGKKTKWKDGIKAIWTLIKYKFK